MCQILSNGKDKDLEEILELLLPSIQQKIKEYSEQPSFNHLMLIQNYISFYDTSIKSKQISFFYKNNI